MTKRAEQLTEAMRERALVRLGSRYETDSDNWLVGYVTAVGPRFFMLAVVSDRMWFDGFACMRVSDVRSVRYASRAHTAFVETALKRRGERRPLKPRVRLATIDELLLSAGRAFPLVAIFRERLDPEVCHIGRVLSVGGGCVQLREVSTDAEWEPEPDEYKLGEITRIDFGGDYEDALHLVAGDLAE